MFEQIITRIVAGLGLGDQVIAASGPTACILAGMLGANLVAQLFKFPLSLVLVRPPAFDWGVRVLTVVAGTLIAHGLGDSLNWAWASLAGLSAWGFYHLTLAVIRRFWPWLEVFHMVGSVDPPPTAQQAAAQRAADRSGQDSGA